MKRGARVIQTIARPSNILIPTVVHAPIEVMKKLTRYFLLDSSWTRGGTFSVPNPNIEILRDTRRVSCNPGISLLALNIPSLVFLAQSGPHIPWEHQVSI